MNIRQSFCTSSKELKFFAHMDRGEEIRIVDCKSDTYPLAVLHIGPLRIFCDDPEQFLEIARAALNAAKVYGVSEAEEHPRPMGVPDDDHATGHTWARVDATTLGCTQCDYLRYAPQDAS
jgi:hypothetical protein